MKRLTRSQAARFWCDCAARLADNFNRARSPFASADSRFEAQTFIAFAKAHWPPQLYEQGKALAFQRINAEQIGVGPDFAGYDGEVAA